MANVSININRAVKFTATEASLILESFAHHVAEDARTNHTFVNRSGELENSIKVEKTGTSTEGFVEYRVVAGGVVAYYAVYVELGTIRMSAKPFLRPALERQKARFG
jgi:HK97 gp10 family phage protein